MILRKLANKIGKYTLFLICLIIALILHPITEGSRVGTLGLNIWCLITMIALALSLQGDKRTFKRILYAGGIPFILIFVALIGRLLNWEATLIFHVLLPFGIVFFTYITWIILSSIFKNKDRIGADELSGAIVSYLLLGIIWALLYSYIELLNPNSFSFTDNISDLHAKGSALFYYSFVTLTTLGYGDILPVSQFAQMVAYLEAVAGVMYTAILVAGLVGNIGNKQKT